MCGIVGIIGEVDTGPSRLRRMLAEISHRGPDSEGWWSLDPTGGVHHGSSGGAAPGHVLLGHRRLSVIDLSDGGHQPMSSADGRFHLTYNGEIYNFVELRRTLEAEGRVFRSESDTEVLLQAWEVWGRKTLDRLRGMFAFAIVDIVERTVTLVRDPFGIKPLFYAASSGCLVFGSEIRALLASGFVERRADPQVLYEYLRWGLVDHQPQTMVAGVCHLPAGHIAEVHLDEPTAVRPVRYWSLPDERLEVAPEDAASEVRRLFLRSVEVHLRSDVPVGTALSGGIDSSGVICAVRAIQGPEAEVHAFAYIPDDPSIDEERWVDLAAGASSAIVHKVRINGGDLERDLDELILAQGEPFVSTSMYAQRRVFEAARAAGVTVLLDGQGADEVFGGYRRFLAGHLRGLVRGGHLVQAGRLAAGVARMPGTTLSPATTVRILRSMVPTGFIDTYAGRALASPLPAWIDAGRLVELNVATGGNPDSLGGGLSETLLNAVRSTTLPSLLRYEDRSSMAASRESRVPFLDLDLAAYVFSLPSSTLVGRDGTTKLVLRRALRGIVPDPILDRRDKIGFAAPGVAWMRDIGPWARSIIRSAAAARLPIDVEECSTRLEAVIEGRRAFDWEVWRWVNAARWLELLDLEM